MYCIVWIVLFYVLFVCKYVLYYCHRLSTQLQLTKYINNGVWVVKHFLTYKIFNETLQNFRLSSEAHLGRFPSEFIFRLHVDGKQSLYRPGQALMVPGGQGSQILRQSAHEDRKGVSPTHRPSSNYPNPIPHEEIFFVLFSVICWEDPRVRFRAEAAC
jgi:hypothetical protein